MSDLEQVVDLIRKSRYGVAFTGAGVSVESGISPFRGQNGLWEKYDPIFVEIEYFRRKPFQSWTRIKEVFYDVIGQAEPNRAHHILAAMEKRGFIESLITQNIDGLHQRAGSKYVYELHGTSQNLVCTECSSEYDLSFADLNYLPPTCYICKGLLKPDMVFFNEPIPAFALSRSRKEAEKSDLFVIIGAKGEVMPAAGIPLLAKQSGAKIIEINIDKTDFTDSITDLFIQGKAGEVMKEIGSMLYLSED